MIKIELDQGTCNIQLQRETDILKNDLLYGLPPAINKIIDEMVISSEQKYDLVVKLMQKIAEETDTADKIANENLRIFKELVENSNDSTSETIKEISKQLEEPQEQQTKETKRLVSVSKKLIIESLKNDLLSLMTLEQGLGYGRIQDKCAIIGQKVAIFKVLLDNYELKE